MFAAVRRIDTVGWLVSILRIALGFMFFWAFVDKLFGLGFSTPHGKAWINGVSPAYGFLHSTSGWFADVFHTMAGNAVVDWLYMLGLAGIGLALILGVALRAAAWSGSVLVLLMWLAVLPIKTNPFVDQHVLFFFLLWLFASVAATKQFGLGVWWMQLPLVQKYRWIQ